MKRISLTLSFVITMFLLIGCSVSSPEELESEVLSEEQISFNNNEDTSTNENANDAIFIRVENVSNDLLENIFVDTSGGQESYGNLESNEISEYKEFHLAFKYAYIEIQIDGSTYKIQPVDYVGETPLENGNYTYIIDTNVSDDEYSKLELGFRID